MAIIKCSECEREINDNLSACSYCGNPLSDNRRKNFFNDATNENKTEKNVNFILKLAQIIRGVSYIGAIIIIIITLLIYGIDDETFWGIFLGGMVALIGFLATPFLEWKAYMLKNIYEINKKEGR